MSTGQLSPQSLLQGRYSILKLAGQGGMGAVYQARDTQTNKQVAIKEMGMSNVSPDKLAYSERCFEQEAQILSSLSHPNLPRVYNYFHESGRSYMVMDFIEGKTLERLILEANNQQLPINDVFNYAKQLSGVLHYLHTYRDATGQLKPLVFRDLKPSNVMVTANGHIYLIDFGIARFFTVGSAGDTQAIGTEGYSPPEQFSRHTTPRSDLYSLGATLFVCLTGQNPKNNTPTLFDFPPVRNLNPRVPLDVETLIRWLVATREQDRPESAARVLHELQGIEQRAQNATSTLATNPSGSGIGGLGVIFYDAKTARAAQYYVWLTHANKLPGLLGKLWKTYIIPVLISNSGAIISVLLKMYNIRGILKAFSRPVWTKAFWSLFLLLTLAVISGSMYLLKTVRLSPYMVALYLALFLAILTLSFSFHARITRSYARYSLQGTLVAALFTCVSLLALPQVQQTLQKTTLNQLLSAGLALLGISTLLRSEWRFTWLDHLTLAGIATISALLEAARSMQALLQIQEAFKIPFALDQCTSLVVYVTLAISVVALLLFKKDFNRFERFLLCVLAVFAFGLQIGFGQTEVFPLLYSGSGNVRPLFSPEIAYAFLAFGPIVMAAIAFTQKSSFSARLALTTMSLTIAYLQNTYGGTFVIHWSQLPLPPYALSTTVLKALTFYQIVAYGLLVAAFVLLIRLRTPFAYIDRIAIFAVAIVSLALQSSSWSSGAALQALPVQGRSVVTTSIAQGIGPTLTLMVGLNEGVTWFLGGSIALALFLFVLNLILKLSVRNPFAGHLSSLEQFITNIDHVMVLLAVIVCLLLHLSLGTREALLATSFVINGFQFTLHDIGTVILIGAILLALARFSRSYNSFDRLIILCCALTCAFLLFGDQGSTYIPLAQPEIAHFIQHVPVWLLKALLVLTSLLIVLAAFSWLRNIVQMEQRGLLLLFFGGAALCVLLQIATPVALVVGFILLVQGTMLATQMEKVKP